MKLRYDWRCYNMYLRKIVTAAIYDIVANQDYPDPDCDITSGYQYWTKSSIDNRYG